jgi:hypothetical protein
MKLLITVLMFVLLAAPLRAEETTIFEVESASEKKLDISGITKFYVTKPQIAEAKLVDGELIIKGRQKGTTTLYVWKNNQAFVYLIKTIKSKAVKTQKQVHRTVVVKSKKPNGRYYVNNVAGFGKQVYNSDKMNVQSFYLNVPFESGDELNFKTSLLTTFVSDFSALKSLNLSNIYLSYKTPNSIFTLGDTNYINPINSKQNINPFNSNLKGLRYSFFNKDYNFDFFTGFAQNQLIIYDRNPELISNLFDKFYVTGAAGQINKPVKDLDVFGSVTSRFDFNDENAKYINLDTGFDWAPAKNFELISSIGTNFYGLGLRGTTYYKYAWEKTDEWISLNATARYLTPHFLRINSPPEGNYNLSLNSKHISGFNIGGFYTINFLNNLADNRTLRVKVSKDIGNRLANVFVQGTNFEFVQGIRNTFTLGSSFKTDIPVHLRYDFTQNISTVNTNYINQFFIGATLLRISFLSLNYSGNVSLVTNNPANQLNINNNLLAGFILSRELLANLSLSYYSFFPDLRNSTRQDNLRFGLNANWRINHNNILTSSINYNTGLGNNTENNSLTTTLGYTYNFGLEFKEFYGDIKGIVFEDLNDNGVYEPGEKVLPGVRIYSTDKSAVTTTEGYTLGDVDFGTQEVFVDTTTLPEGYRVTSPSPTNINFNSKESVVNFAVRNLVLVRGIIFSNKNRTEGLENIELTLDDNIKVKSDQSGAYMFKTTAGKHNIRINPLTIPPGYSLKDKLVKEFEIGKEDLEINFGFKPVMSLKGLAYFVDTKKPAANITLNITFNDYETEKETTVKTDENGYFLIKDLEEGTLDIDSPLLTEPLEFEILPKPGEVSIKVPLPSEKIKE